MQEGCEDYYKWGLDIGCCLNCAGAYEGCLCYICLCTKCYWYIPPEEWNGKKGKCGLVVKRKNDREESWISKFSESVKNKNPQKELSGFEK